MSIVFIISAPSGSGKSTIVNRVLEEDSSLSFSVSYTTRSPRGAEREGESYNYISRGEFEACVAQGEFLEHAEVFGNYYGTHRRVLEKAEAEGRDLVLDIDVQGARQLKDRIPEAVTVFVLAPSRADLEQRLRTRSEDSEPVIQRRLHDATKEIQFFQEAVDTIRHYSLYDYVIINEQVGESVGILKAIVKAERARRFRMEPRIGPILATFGSRTPEAP